MRRERRERQVESGGQKERNGGVEGSRGKNRMNEGKHWER